MTAHCVSVPSLYGKPHLAFHFTVSPGYKNLPLPQHIVRDLVQLCGVWGKSSMQQLIYFCILVFTASCMFDSISLIKIKNSRPSWSSCGFFSQNMGDTVIVLWLQDACGMLVTTLGSGQSRRPESRIDHCKVTSAWVLGMRFAGTALGGGQGRGHCPQIPGEHRLPYHHRATCGE